VHKLAIVSFDKRAKGGTEIRVIIKTKIHNHVETVTVKHDDAIGSLSDNYQQSHL
jgi:hypothetical protein